MSSLKNFLISSCIAGLALAHPRHSKRGTVPVDGTIITSCTTKGVVALTFDDGPYEYTQEIVDKLTAAGHRATFFQNGQNWDNIYNYNSTLLSMISGGHQICSHTWSHADLATLTVAQITSEMQQLEVAHQNILGYYPTYMRPPYLSTNAQALSTLKTLGYKIVEVDIDTQDWAEGPAGEIDLSIQWYEGNQTAGGTLSLNHDPYQPTAETFVPTIITYLASKNLKSVTVGECLGDDKANWYRVKGASSSSAAPSSTSKAASSSSHASSASASASSHSSAAASTSHPAASSSSAHPSSAGSSAVPSSAGQSSAPSSVGQSAAPSSAGQSAAPSSAGQSVAPSTGPSSAAQSVAPSAGPSSAAGVHSSAQASVAPSAVASSAAASPSGVISPDWSCGGSKGYICPSGSCCSAYGWCGTGDNYCTNGCQSAFGKCSSTSSGSGSTGSSSGSYDLTGGTCGGSTGYVCPGTQCCSQYGYCGTGKAYCG